MKYRRCPIKTIVVLRQESRAPAVAPNRGIVRISGAGKIAEDNTHFVGKHANGFLHTFEFEVHAEIARFQCTLKLEVAGCEFSEQPGN